MAGKHVKKKEHKGGSAKTVIAVIVLVALLGVLGYFVVQTYNSQKGNSEPVVSEEPQNSQEPEESEEPVITPEPLKEIDFEPHSVESTNPEKYIKTTGIQVDDVKLENEEDYDPIDKYEFGLPEEYTDVEGIVTFRGNNFRDTASYGYAEMQNYKFGKNWYKTTASLSYNGETWTGSGWVGQPLIMKWPKETKAVMNMYDWAKQDDNLVEVIYACMDGYVYFMDLQTGKATRDSLNLGFTFKGAGALDPRGYPILYVGAGYDSSLGRARVNVVSLIDGKVLYTFGNNDNFSLRGDLSYFDSSALVDAETDTLIYPGENGILYFIKLNTEYDEKAGTLSINPSNITKWHYYGQRTSLASYWVGMEDSCAIYKGYLFMADNGGNLMCMDINTLQLVWVQDILDDSNGSPVLSIEDDHLYIYISTSFHLGWRSTYKADVPVWKIDAETGEIVWQKDYNCFSEKGVSGGTQSTIAVGANDLEEYVYVTVARTGDQATSGVLACLDKKTGEEEWKHRAYYTWSSPVCVYNSDGSGKILYCTYGGTMYLLDGLTGSVLDTFDMQGGAEASPAVYNNWAVVGTRKMKIWGVELT